MLPKHDIFLAPCVFGPEPTLSFKYPQTPEITKTCHPIYLGIFLGLETFHLNSVSSEGGALCLVHRQFPIMAWWLRDVAFLDSTKPGMGCWSGIQTRKVLSNSSSTKDSKGIKIRGEGGGLHLSALMALQGAICFLFNTVSES